MRRAYRPGAPPGAILPAPPRIRKDRAGKCSEEGGLAGQNLLRVSKEPSGPDLCLEGLSPGQGVKHPPGRRSPQRRRGQSMIGDPHCHCPGPRGWGFLLFLRCLRRRAMMLSGDQRIRDETVCRRVRMSGSVVDTVLFSRNRWKSPVGLLPLGIRTRTSSFVMGAPYPTCPWERRWGSPRARIGVGVGWLRARRGTGLRQTARENLDHHPQGKETRQPGATTAFGDRRLRYIKIRSTRFRFTEHRSLRNSILFFPPCQSNASSTLGSVPCIGFIGSPLVWGL